MKYILILSICLIIMQCQAQNNDGSPVEEPIDAISPAVPFLLERNNIYEFLPDSLGGGKVNGTAVLKVYINEDKKLQGFKIMKLKLSTNADEDFIDYVNNMPKKYPLQKEDYPLNVQMYFDYFNKYMQKLSFIRDKKVPLDSLNEITFMVKFK